VETNKPGQVENRSGKDRRQLFLNGPDRRQSVEQGEEGPQADSVALIETAGVEQITFSQSMTGIESN
jgi:hypothetical protein